MTNADNVDIYQLVMAVVPNNDLNVGRRAKLITTTSALATSCISNMLKNQWRSWLIYCGITGQRLTSSAICHHALLPHKDWGEMIPALVAAEKNTRNAVANDNRDTALEG